MSASDASEFREIGGTACQRFVSRACSASNGAAEITAATAIKIRRDLRTKLSSRVNPNRVILLAILCHRFYRASNPQQSGQGRVRYPVDFRNPAPGKHRVAQLRR